MTPNRIDQPRAGFYRTKLIRKGIVVPVEIYFGQPVVDGELQDRSHRWCAVVDGKTDQPAVDQDGNTIGREPLDVLDVWAHCAGDPITKTEYEFLTRRRVWAREHEPNHPAADARKPIDVRKQKPAW